MRSKQGGQCSTCGGETPKDLDAWDQYLTRGGDCPGRPTRDHDGTELGCGAWTADAYREEAEQEAAS